MIEAIEKEVSTVYAELTTEQKLAVREAHYILNTVREQAAAAIKNAEQALVKTVEGLAKELKVGENAVFNFGPLTFTDKK